MIRTQVVVAALMVGLTVPAAAQRGAVDETAEIQQLRDSAYLVERDLSSLGQRDAARAEQLQLRLEDLQEEIVYLKVKQRKEGSVQRRDTQTCAFASRACGPKPGPPPRPRRRFRADRPRMQRLRRRSSWRFRSARKWTCA